MVSNGGLSLLSGVCTVFCDKRGSLIRDVLIKGGIILLVLLVLLFSFGIISGGLSGLGDMVKSIVRFGR